MHMDEKMKDCLEKASLYSLLGEKYKYIDPEKHMDYYQKYLYYANMVDQMYMQMNMEGGYNHSRQAKEK